MMLFFHKQTFYSRIVLDLHTSCEDSTESFHPASPNYMVPLSQLSWNSIYTLLFTMAHTSFGYPQLLPNVLSLSQDPIQGAHCIYSSCLLLRLLLAMAVSQTFLIHGLYGFEKHWWTQINNNNNTITFLRPCIVLSNVQSPLDILTHLISTAST